MSHFPTRHIVEPQLFHPELRKNEIDSAECSKLQQPKQALNLLDWPDFYTEI